ncbi:unnamed protein product [Notodromas monacha]|uniref:acid phosphatase n=1 Tax=Notodromas monacha TaxID=399045 RepID=A0A7R9GI89_9CRUS|nr:unnamed protein product [Notodromas monacha]CAG0922338.1 unnamed protein product [Notodromas monacha]
MTDTRSDCIVNLLNADNVSDNDFKLYISEAEEILRKMALCDFSVDNMTNPKSSPNGFLLAASVADAVKSGAGEGFLKTALSPDDPSGRKRMISTSLFLPLVERWGCSNPVLRPHYPELVDCEWRYSITLGDSIVGKQKHPSFSLEFTSISEDAPSTQRLECSVQDLESLLYGHGDRTPISFYPTDPHKCDKLRPVRSGQLLSTGKLRHFQLGKWLRERYAGFLGKKYDPAEVHTKSTNVDRTLMSAQCNLAGMFPLGDDENWDLDSESFNFTHPDWTAAVFHERLQPFAAISFTVSSLTPKLRRLRGGPLVTFMVENMKQKAGRGKGVGYLV